MGNSPSVRGPCLLRPRLLVLGLLAGLAACAGEEAQDPPWMTQGGGSGSPAPAPGRVGGPPPAEVVVEPGDTVYGLSRRYGVPARTIIEANGLQPPYVLQVGQRLMLPQPRTYTVRRGDSLSVIARDHKVEMSTLARLNRLEPPYRIRVGQVLSLPDGPIGGGDGGSSAGRPAAAAAVMEEQPTRGVAGEPLVPASAPASRPATGPAQAAEARPQPPAPPPRAARAFAWPVRGPILSRFGPAGQGLRNDGINIGAPLGTPIKAADNGVVVYAGNELKGFGNLLLVRHADGYMTAYGHCAELTAKRGETVARGQTIATVGQSGNASQPQVHFEIRKGSQPLDPLTLLERQVSALP